MQDALPKQQNSTLPNEILLCIFNLLPFATRKRFDTISKFWHKTYQDPYFYLGSEHALLKMYDIKTSPLLFHRFQRSLNSKAKWIASRKEATLWDSILYMLVAYLHEIEDTCLKFAQSELQHQITEVHAALARYQYTNLPYDLNLASVLSRTLFLIQYVKSDERFKSANRQTFLECCPTDGGAIFLNFSRGNLSGENLSGKCFAGSNLIEINLANATLQQTNLCNTNLMGADLRGVKGKPKFNRNTILIDAKMDYCLKNAARENGAIFTLRDLAQRIKENSADYPNADMFFIKIVKTFLENQIKYFEPIPRNDKDLNSIKLSILKKLLLDIKEAETKQDMIIVREAIKKIMTESTINCIDTGERMTPYEVASKPHAFISGICKDMGLFDGLIHTKIQDIIDEVCVALKVLEPPEVDITSNRSTDKDIYRVYHMTKY